jgi:hypothetical protein
MSYLSTFRLHFHGTFCANVPTANNDFERLDPGTIRNDGDNPDGNSSWVIYPCEIAAAYDQEGAEVAQAGDELFSLDVRSGLGRSAKIVDLDPQQPRCPTIYGLQLVLMGADKLARMTASCAPTTMKHIDRYRTPAETEDAKLGAMFQTTAKVDPSSGWGDLSESPWLRALQVELAKPGALLSIKFNVDGCVMEVDPRGTGRIVGTIGVHTPDEPHHFVLGRHLVRYDGLNDAVAIVLRSKQTLRVDLGNSLPFAKLRGEMKNIGPLFVRCKSADPAKKHTVDFPPIEYRVPYWYEKSAGVIDLAIPVDELDFVDSNPLEVWCHDENGNPTNALIEADNGLYLASDVSVFRLSPNDSCSFELIATKYGYRLPQAGVAGEFVDSLLSEPENAGGPVAGTPRDALSWSSTDTNADGKATVTLKTGDPGWTRHREKNDQYLDGQVYSLRFLLKESLLDPDYPVSIWEAVHVRVWEVFDGKNPTWTGTVKPILAYYRRHFPFMDFIDFSDPQKVLAVKQMLLDSMERPFEDAGYMPTTRDLSPAKSAAVVAWLRHPSPPIDPPPLSLLAELAKNFKDLFSAKPKIKLPKYAATKSVTMASGLDALAAKNKLP